VWLTIIPERQSGSDMPSTGEDLFDVGLEDAAVTQAKDKAARRATGRDKPNVKRQKKDSKFGFGGKKRFSKSGDAQSSAEMKGFSTKKMKGGAKKRPGKSRRAKMG
jgi:rRNA-processing protein EBP2